MATEKREEKEKGEEKRREYPLPPHRPVINSYHGVDVIIIHIIPFIMFSKFLTLLIVKDRRPIPVDGRSGPP